MNQILQFSDLMYEIGKWAGVIGFSLLSSLIFSGDTARYWDKYLGLDRIIKFQRKFSYFVATFVILHPLFFIISKKTVLDFIIPNFSYLPLALGIISFYVFIASGKHNPKILKGCGLEATSMFDKVGKHLSKEVQGMMPGFVIGDLK